MTQSNVKWVRLGDYIEQTSERNTKGLYGLDDVMGMTITKEIIPTKANLSGNDLSKFLVVHPSEFVYNPRTHGKKIGLGYNRTLHAFLISWNNIAFRVKDENTICPTFLYMYCIRDEWDRHACVNSWGSSTEVFSWNALCEMEIPLPSIERQREIVETWQGLRKMKEENEAIAAPLMQLCQSYIQDLKKKYPLVEIGPYIIPSDETNSSGKNLPILGLNKDKVFMPTAANTSTVDVKKYKIVKKGRFAFSGMQTGRDVCIRLSLYDSEEPAIISPAYSTFELDESKGLLSEYMYLMFTRPEMDRLGWFYSDSSVRSNLDWSRFISIKIPLPPIEIQRAIVNIYNCAKEAKRIAQEADNLSREICPALMQHVTNN